MPEIPALMIAGPGELLDEELAVLGQQVTPHYGDVWVELHDQLLGDLGRLLGCADKPYVIPGTGTTCLDAGVMNLFEPGETVVVPQTGFFGHRLGEVARANRLNVIDIKVEVGAPIQASEVAEAIASNGAAGVLSVHTETSTGVTHPIEEIAKAAHGSGARFLVDGIASVGGEIVDVDRMEIDLLVTGTQKGLESPPGLGIIALGTGARTKIDSRKDSLPSWYLDLKRWDTYREKWPHHPHPVTMPTNLVSVLAASVRRILERGPAEYVKERAELAAYCRDGLSSAGLKLVAKQGSEANLVVAAYADDPEAIINRLFSDGIMISGGLAPLAGKSIRVGLMGRTATTEMVDRVVSGVRDSLQ